MSSQMSRAGPRSTSSVRSARHCSPARSSSTSRSRSPPRGSSPTPTRASRRRSRRPSRDAKVVKTLSSVPATLMTNPKALSGPSTEFLSGDDPAKQTLAGLLTDLGWRPREYQLDLGGITTARGPEHLVPLLLGVYDALGTTAVSINVVR